MNNIFGTAASETLTGSFGNDSIYGYAGNDRINTSDGVDYVEGGNGDDTISKYLKNGASTLLGGAGNDTIWGGNGNDIIDGGEGDDSWLEGYKGNDIIRGGSGNDKLYGSDGDDDLNGGAGKDELNGGDGNDILDGGEGNDELFGGGGNDTYHVRSKTQFIYDSAGTDTAYVYASFVKIPSTIENVQYREGALALPNWISALIPDAGAGLRFSDLLGNSKTFFYTFPTAIPAHHAANTEYKLDWTAFTSTQQTRVESALSYISTVIGVRFVKSTDSTALNTITFANNNQTNSAGYANFPYENSAGSDLFLDNSGNSDNAFLRDGNYSAYVLIHELGHSLGLRHPFASANTDGGTAEPPYLSSAEDKTAWTVMSYTDSSSEYFLRFSPLDIAALQYMYGPSTTTRTGNDSYSINAFGANFIWDGGGIDELSAASTYTGCTIYLAPGYWGYVGTSKASSITSSGQITVNFGTVIENLTGSQYADALYGNEAGNTINGGDGNDVIEGWAGDDTLIGGLGDDRIDGGDGVDVAFFNRPRANYVISWSSASSSFTVRSNVEGTDTLVGIETLKFTDVSVPASLFQDTAAPTISLSANKASLGVSETASLTFTLSEASTTFTASDVTATGGTLSNFAGSGTTYTALFTPTANSTTSGVVRVTSGVFTDAAGNANADGADSNNTVTMTVNTLQKLLVIDTSLSATYNGAANQHTLRFDPLTKALMITDSNPQSNHVRKFTEAKRIEFDDLTLNLEVNDVASTIPETALDRIAELYVAFFNRVPDGDGMQYWIGQYKGGKSINDIAESFYSAGVFYSEITGYRPDMTRAEFISVIYKNVLGRDEVDSAGMAYWDAALATGAETKATLVNTILNAAHSIEFSDPNNPYHWVQKLLDNKLDIAKTISIEWGVNYNTAQDSISKGMAIAAAVTSNGIDEAIGLVGVHIEYLPV